MKRIKRRFQKSITKDSDINEYIAELKTGVQHCYYCDKEIFGGDITIEHLVPLSKGGTHTKDNIVPACRHCNTTKNNKEPMEYVSYCIKNNIKISDTFAVDGQIKFTF